jgi:Ca2+/Na+ antiporter
MKKVTVLRPKIWYICLLLIIVCVCVCYSLKRLRKEAQLHKSQGNEQFKAGDYQESAKSYTLGLRSCPLAFDKDRAVMYSNRAAAKVKLVSVFVF